MADTVRGHFPDVNCSDCGEKGTIIRHWGSLVPEESVGNFCYHCWNMRIKANERGEAPKPLGVKPTGVPKEFANKIIRVTTESGSVYVLGSPDDKGGRSVFCANRDMDFNNCRVLCLAVGESLWLKSFDDEFFWVTSHVVSIQ